MRREALRFFSHFKTCTNHSLEISEFDWESGRGGSGSLSSVGRIWIDTRWAASWRGAPCGSF